jgi:vacuolar-type H+-ATPase subunit D/Vma8
VGSRRLQVTIINPLYNSSQKVQDSVARASIRVDTNTENIAGVYLPIFVVKEIEDQGKAVLCLESNIN